MLKADAILPDIDGPRRGYLFAAGPKVERTDRHSAPGGYREAVRR